MPTNFRQKKTLILALTLLFCSLSINESIGQKRTKSKKVTPIAKVIPNTPFNFFLGNWSSYNKESSFAAYCNVKSIAQGSAVEIHVENPDGTVSVGLIYEDPILKRWKLAWVGPDHDDWSGNGVRELRKSADPLSYIFEGETVLNGNRVKDRYVFENVNKETVVMQYEISTDNAAKWDTEYKFTFKKSL